MHVSRDCPVRPAASLTPPARIRTNLKQILTNTYGDWRSTAIETKRVGVSPGRHITSVQRCPLVVTLQAVRCVL